MYAPRSETRSVAGVLGGLVLLLAISAPASASVLLGGVDVRSEYDALTGVFSFQADGTPGDVTSSDLGGLGASDLVFFEASLNATKCDAGSTPFNPGTDAPQGACFVPVSGATPDLIFTDATGMITLLEFQLDHISVTQAFPSLGANDPDGFLIMGDFVETTESVLTLTGGTLAAAAGGLGSTAHLHVRMDTLVPGLTLANFSGYLGNDFEAGDGVGNSPVVWDLLIIPIPEPSTGTLLAGALATLAYSRKRARRA